MLDIRKTGTYISHLRKEKDMTQIELADMLNVSHQAVSKWERGESMPDIGLLPKLSEIFGVSIDNILMGGSSAGQKESTNTVAELIAHNDPDSVAQMINEGEANLLDIVDLAPVVKPSVIDNVADKLDGISMEQLVSLAPFLSKNALSRLIDRITDGSVNAQHLTGIAPFLDEDDLDKLVDKIPEGNVDSFPLPALAPFLGSKTLSKLVGKAADGTIDPGILTSIAPFLDENDFDNIIDKIASNDLNENLLTSLAPFLGERALCRLIDKMAEGSISTGLLVSIAPFLGEDGILKAIRKIPADNIDAGIFSSLAPFLSGDTLGSIICSIADREKSR